MGRARLRDLGITIGTYQPGEYNAITDVPGIWVGHRTLIFDEPMVARTGVTVILPRGDQTKEDFTFAGYHSFNGCGEMTGLLWVEESGLLTSPIGLTNTNQVGLVRDAIVEYAVDKYGAGTGFAYKLPVVAETYDGWLNDIDAFHVTRADVYEALESASGGPVAEGNVGGGTGTICHDFKGGIGTSSRVVDAQSGRFTVGALVQANHGDRELLRMDGVPVGREIGPLQVPLPWVEPPVSSSIIVVLATDAPLLPSQCRRLAQRATVGLARAGGVGYNASGDIFLAFSSANHYPRLTNEPLTCTMLPMQQMNSLFEAAAEAVEESILNALVAAETMVGLHGRTAYELPLDDLLWVMEKYRGRE